MTFEEYIQDYASRHPVHWAGGVPWSTYRRVLKPLCHPHVQPQARPAEIAAILKQSKALLALWTSDFDSQPSPWWYIIGRAPYDLETLRIKTRYKVRHGIRLCEVRRITGQQLADHGYPCYQAAMRRHTQTTPLDQAAFRRLMPRRDGNPSTEFWGVYHDSQLAGYARYKIIDDIGYEEDVILAPEFFKHHSSYALVHTTTQHYLNDRSCAYIVSGWRSVSHETGWQDFTEKEFCRRKAYCHFSIKYSAMCKILSQTIFHTKRYLDYMKIPGRVKNILTVVYNLEVIRRTQEAAGR